MRYNIKLGEKRKLFCKECFFPFIEPSIRIKNNMVTITCEKCNHKNRWKFAGEINLPLDKDHEEECAC